MRLPRLTIDIITTAQRSMSFLSDWGGSGVISKVLCRSVAKCVCAIVAGLNRQLSSSMRDDTQA